jgi:TonB family protein
MRTPLLLALLLLLGLGAACRAQDTRTPSAEPPISCDTIGSVWIRDDGSIVVDRRVEKRYGIQQAAYRLDDKNGYWLYPASGADVVVLTKPNGATDPVNVSIARATDAYAVERLCEPIVRIPSAKPPSDAATFEGTTEAGLLAFRHVDDPLSCDMPFANGSVTRAKAPEVPLLAAQNGIEGNVTVEVTLDPSGAVTKAIVTHSPSPLLNNAAIDAAKQTQFTPTYFRCRPIAARYAFLVEFAFTPRKN